jgi:hypothetical protein
MMKNVGERTSFGSKTTHGWHTPTKKGSFCTTMVFSAAANAARRQIAVMAAHQKPSAHQTQRRAMASGPAPEWQGIDKVVRGVFPHDHQRTFFSRFHIPYTFGAHFSNSMSFISPFPPVAMAIMGGYSALFVLYKITSAISKPKQQIAPDTMAEV